MPIDNTFSQADLPVEVFCPFELQRFHIRLGVYTILRRNHNEQEENSEQEENN